MRPILAAALMFLVTQTVSATPIVNRNTGLASPDVVLDFGSNQFSNGAIITGQYVSTAGVYFTGGRYAYGTTSLDAPALSAGYIGSSNSSQLPTPILFSNDVQAAAFSLRTTAATVILYAYLDGVQVASYATASNDSLATGRFYGFEDVVLDEVRWYISSSSRGFTIDNLQYTLVPEPSTAALLGLALVGLAGKRRRQAVGARRINAPLRIPGCPRRPSG